MSHRTLALLRWDFHFLRVRVTNVLNGADEKLLKRTFSAPHSRYLNLGSGPRGLDSPHWINVDGFADTNVHHVMDFARPFPFPDKTFQGIFSEHVFEHFSREDGVALFRESRRILGDGGILRVIVPDAAKVIEAYRVSPELLVTRRNPPTGLPMEVVNQYAYQRYEHQCLYDWALLERTLRDAGFAEIRLRDYRDSADPALAIDDSKYEWESLYVEAHRT